MCTYSKPFIKRERSGVHDRRLRVYNINVYTYCVRVRIIILLCSSGVIKLRAFCPAEVRQFEGWRGRHAAEYAILRAREGLKSPARAICFYYSSSPPRRDHRNGGDDDDDDDVDEYTHYKRGCLERTLSNYIPFCFYIKIFAHTHTHTHEWHKFLTYNVPWFYAYHWKCSTKYTLHGFICTFKNSSSRGCKRVRNENEINSCSCIITLQRVLTVR